LLEGCLRILYEWSNEQAKTSSNEVVRSLIRPPVPVVQGWRAADYQRSLDLKLAVWERWRGWLAPPDLVGVGLVCRRDIHHPQYGLHAIIACLEGRAPRETRHHLFGVKGSVIEQLKMMPHVASTDSMAYDYGARRKAHAEGRTNSIELRTASMSRWMANALIKSAPAAGDQFRLF
jgi:hypothetical protein